MREGGESEGDGRVVRGRGEGSEREWEGDRVRGRERGCVRVCLRERP